MTAVIGRRCRKWKPGRSSSHAVSESDSAQRCTPELFHFKELPLYSLSVPCPYPPFPPPFPHSAHSSRPAPASQVCEGPGFFYLRGHGISEDLKARVFQQMEALFALPLVEKMKVKQVGV